MFSFGLFIHISPTDPTIYSNKLLKIYPIDIIIGKSEKINTFKLFYYNINNKRYETADIIDQTHIYAVH